MPAGARWSDLLLVGLVGILLILEDWLRRRSSPSRHAHPARASQRLQQVQLGTILLAPVVALSAMWLTPWAAALASSGPAALLPGLLILVPLLASLRYALVDVESDG
jgi:hypothetical protein